MKARIRERLEVNGSKPYRARYYERVPVDMRYKQRQFTEEEGTALLAQFAPDWRLHLNDGRVIDQILARLP